MRPVQLYRRWRRAAGAAYGRYVPAAPFSDLGALPGLLGLPVNPPADDLAEILAAGLVASPEGARVLAGEAAFVLDLPGYLSLAVGAYLQLDNITPVSLVAGFYQSNAVLNGRLTLESLIYYGPLLTANEVSSQEEPSAISHQPSANSNQSSIVNRQSSIPLGVAFLLERERLPKPRVDDFTLLRVFDNRYHVGDGFFPPFELLQAQGIKAFIDVRAANDEIPFDLNDYYTFAAENDFDIYSSVLKLERLPV